MTQYDIIDLDLLDCIETLYPGYGIWTCEALLSDGTTVMGTVHGDGISGESETFEADDTDDL